ncbi:MAG TPA: VWA domain-containing protein [Chloroflexi bacterium]|jgi:uncharacterized protein with von Willebrand factor type A (vWA) domain|nr:VWA domain-containing protein [Chloroflexota bacterium]
MEERIAKFVAALRAAGVRVSLAESEDAWRAIRHMGVKNRDWFRWTLRSTLVKDASSLPIFDELFPLYFGVDQPPMLNPQDDMSPEEQDMLQKAMEDLAGELQQLLNWLMNGRQPSQEELQELAEQAGLDQATSTSQAERYARRMQRLLHWEQLQELLELLWELLAEQGMDPETIQQLKERVAQNMEALQKQLEQFAGQAIGEQTVEEYQKRPPSVDELMHRPFELLTEEERRRLRDEVRRLAARLRSHAALRQKRGQDGRLDAKSTIRANLRYGGVPMELRFRTRRLRPKLVTLLDVSTSMRPVTEFFLWLLYELQDQIQKARSFAYIDHLEEVSEDLAKMPPDDAMRAITSKLPPGHYNTDFGASLRQFEADHMDAVDFRTTVIVLGDGRNNLQDPALDTFSDLGRRSRRIIWMNPEYPAQWGTGDSDMLEYAPLCSEVFQVRNLAQLAAAVDRMLVD